MKNTEYMGYTVYENGDVLGKQNKILKRNNASKGINTKVYNIRYNGQLKVIPCNRFVYQAFNPEKNINNYRVKSKEGHHIDNLYLIKSTGYQHGKTKKEIQERLDENINDYEREILLWVLNQDTQK